MNTAELMARLNPSTVRYDVGRGGIPELTSQDIAAAIAFVPEGLGRELMCHFWWPDGAALTAGNLDRALTDRQLEEWTCRERGMYQALGALACADSKTAHDAASRRYADAHARRWPQWIERTEPVVLTEKYELLRKAVLEEAMNPKRCTVCGGGGEVTVRAKKSTCDRCLGVGTTRHGPTWRSAALKMKESSYKETWHEPYEWLLTLVVSLAEVASMHLRRAVSRQE